MPFTPDYHVTEERRAYTLRAGRTGLLVVHGFMGSPISSRPMAEYLAARGVTVHCPLLPGHGERPDKLYKVPRQAWIDEAEEGLADLRQWCDEIFLLGHSMGTILCAHLVQQNTDIRGMVMLAPLYVVPSKAIHLTAALRYVVPWFTAWQIKKLRPLVIERATDLYPDLNLEDPAVQAQLPALSRVPTSGIDEMRKMAVLGRRLWPKLTLPLLILQGGHDTAVKPGGDQAIYDAVASQDKRLHQYPQAGHELMRPKDPAHQQVWSEVDAFISQHSRERAV